MSKNRKIYTKEFKLEALKLAESIGKAKASLELGVSRKSLENWSKGIGLGSFESKLNSSNSLSITELEKENRKLKKENMNLKIINDVLKKSTAIFSKDQIGG